MSIRDKLSKLKVRKKENGSNKDFEYVKRLRKEEQQNNLNDPMVLKSDFNGEYSVGKFKLKKFFSLFPVYIPFSPKYVESEEKLAFIDLETTGLSTGTGTFPFLTGIGYSKNNIFNVEQIFINSPHMEVNVLLRLKEILRNIEIIVTYNGKTFDIPLLENRFKMVLREEFPNKFHVDLYQLMKKYIKPATLHNVEKHFLEINRDDEEISGSEIPSLFFEYIQKGDFKLMEPVVSRNRQDIISLVALFYKWIELKNPLFFDKK